MVIFGFYNTAMNAWKNRREYKDAKDKPIIDLEERTKVLEKAVEGLETKVQNLEGDSKDLHLGLMTICEGVQALLNHSLADGNEEEMRGATVSINKWLRGR